MECPPECSAKIKGSVFVLTVGVFSLMFTFFSSQPKLCFPNIPASPSAPKVPTSPEEVAWCFSKVFSSEGVTREKNASRYAILSEGTALSSPIFPFETPRTKDSLGSIEDEKIVQGNL